MNKSYVIGSLLSILIGTSIHPTTTTPIENLKTHITSANYEQFKKSFSEYEATGTNTEDRIRTLMMCQLYIQDLKKQTQIRIEQLTVSQQKLGRAKELTLVAPTLVSIICTLIGTASIHAHFYDSGEKAEGIIYGGLALIPAIALGYLAYRNIGIYFSSTKSLEQYIARLDEIDIYLKAKLLIIQKVV